MNFFQFFIKEFIKDIHVRINLRILSSYLPIVVKNTLWGPTKYIYIEDQLDGIYKMMRYAKCRDLRNFLEFKKLEVVKFFFLIFKEFFIN